MPGTLKIGAAISGPRRNQEAVNPVSQTGCLGSTERGGWRRVGRKGWQRVGKRLAKGWRRVGEIPCTLQNCTFRSAPFRRGGLNRLWLHGNCRRKNYGHEPFPELAGNWASSRWPQMRVFLRSSWRQSCLATLRWSTFHPRSSARPGVLLTPSLVQRTLEKQGEELCSKTALRERQKK